MEKYENKYCQNLRRTILIKFKKKLSRTLRNNFKKLFRNPADTKKLHLGRA